MKCQEVREKISTYMDEELDPALSQSIAQHLSGCIVCQEELKAFQNIDTMLKGLPRYELAPEFAEQVILRVSKSSTSAEKSGLLALLVHFFENFFDLLDPPKPSSTLTLDEFGDFPPFSMGYVYFKLLNQIK
jgi:hypothetical protein